MMLTIIHAQRSHNADPDAHSSRDDESHEGDEGDIDLDNLRHDRVMSTDIYA